MRRSLILAAVGMITLSLLMLISAALAAPEAAPSFQSIGEEEPNNSPTQANPIDLNIQVLGVITQTEAGDPVAVLDTDYFVLNTQPGLRYVADLTILTGEAMKLQMRVSDANGGLLGVSTASNSSVQLTWDAPGAPQGTVAYIQIRKQDVPTMTVDTQYQLEVSLWSATATPTRTPTPTPTSAPNPWDAYEQNDTYTTAYVLPVAVSVSLSSEDGKANFAPYNHLPDDDIDWFAFYVRNGQQYQAYTSDLNDADTVLQVYNRNNSTTPVQSDDNGGGGFSSKVTWQASYDGWYYLRVSNNTDTTGTYNLTIAEVGVGTPTATTTALPTNTPIPGADPDADGCENNLNFDTACIIAPDHTQTFNFVPAFPGVDNDFFKLWIKPNLIYECQTSDLAPGIDPNMIVYDQNRNAIGGNDDIEPGDLNSRFAYYAPYEGWLYILVGYGNRTPPNIYNSDYDLTCEISVPGQPSATPTRTSPAATSTPRPDATSTPTSASGSPVPTTQGGNGSADALNIRPMATPTPRPTSEAPSLHFVPVDMLVYYDANSDRSPGAGEGIAGVLLMAYDTATGQEIAQGFTDELGHLEFTAAVQGLVRLRIPYLGISYVVGQDSDTVYVRIAPGSTP
ncbi:MAG: hypothetical protein JXD18_08185 [Anaerolineae bacterium]|nr:hypothetical protein [Anaerolineae bacterium]